MDANDDIDFKNRNCLRVRNSRCLSGGRPAASFRTVALSGQRVPGTPDGVVYRYFNDPPVLNAHGETSFRARLMDASSIDLLSGIWKEDSGVHNLVVREGMQAPDAIIGQLFVNVQSPGLTDEGVSAFPAIVRDELGLSYSGVWTGQSGDAHLVGIDGTQAPGTPSGVKFHGLINGLVLLNSTGQLAFSSFVKGDVVYPSNDIGIWTTSPSGLALLARTGDQAPGKASGVAFSSFSPPVLNDSGVMAFTATTTENAPAVSMGIWSGALGNLQVVVHTGINAPGTSAGVSFEAFNEPTLNSSGEIAFIGFLAGAGVVEANRQGIWSGSSNNLELAARSGDHAAGTGAGVSFSYFNNPLLNDAGDISFRAGVSGTGVTSNNNEGIWIGSGGNLELVARSEGHAPGTPSGARFDDFGAPTLNAGGQVAFIARLLDLLPIETARFRAAWNHTETSIRPTTWGYGQLIRMAF